MPGMDVTWRALVTDSYDILWKMIIRPPRSQYALSELGYPKFKFQDRAYARTDEQVVNDRGLKLECSHYHPLDPTTGGHPKRKLPCVIYLHGNCSSRLEAVDCLRVLLPRNISVYCLDFSGSGLSEGEYISLGYYEEQDLKVVIKHLRACGRVSSIALWGRSMGAATSILRASEDHTLAACVMDSPFSNLRQVAEELVNSGLVTVPDFLLNMALQSVRDEIQKRANFDIEELIPMKKAPRGRSPALFAVAKDDDFVLPHHTERLYEVWGSSADEKKLVTFGGGHNGSRPQWFLDEATTFLESRLLSAAENDDGHFVPKGPTLVAEYTPDLDSDVIIVPAPASPKKKSMPVPDTVLASEAAASNSSTAARNSSAGIGSNAAVRKPTAASAAPSPQPSSEVEKQLVAMGFSADMAAAAYKRHKSVEAAVNWILEESAQIVQKSAKALGNVELRAPSVAAPAALGMGEGKQASPPSSRQGSKPSNAAGAGSKAPKAEEMAPQVLLQHLLDLGFPCNKASDAAMHCKSVEEGVEYILTRS